MVRNFFVAFFLLLFGSHSVSAQHFGSNALSLERVIEMAQANSPNAQMAKLSFMSQYWTFRSYKAQLLPSLNMYSSLGSYNRSLVEVRDTETGEISYVDNNTLSNSVSLSIDQNIALTGGTISLYTDLARMDQFDYSTKIFNSNPLSISYTQPIRGFNSLKWQQKTAPREYESAKRSYLETMEGITVTATSYFFAVLSAQSDYDKAVENNRDTKEMYEIAQKRFAITTISKSELLQLELSLLNSDLAITNSKVSLDMALFNLRLFLGITERDNQELRLIPPANTPNVVMKYEEVLDRAYANSSHTIDQELSRINAEQTVAQARANRGIQISLNANIGLSQSDTNIKGAYSNLIDREVVGITLSMPIYDWGMSRGQVKMAEAQAELAMTEIDQEEVQFAQDIRIKVMKFNNQTTQCAISDKAKQIATERYEITKKRFENNSVSVTELNTALEEKNSADEQYITQLQTFWNAYYELRKLALYDFINKVDLSAEYDKLVE